MIFAGVRRSRCSYIPRKRYFLRLRERQNLVSSQRDRRAFIVPDATTVTERIMPVFKAQSTTAFILSMVLGYEPI